MEDLIGKYEQEIDSPDDSISGQKTEIVIADVEMPIERIGIGYVSIGRTIPKFFQTWENK